LNTKGKTTGKRFALACFPEFGTGFFSNPVLAGLSSAGGDGLKILDVRRLRSRQVSKISVRSEQRKVPVATA
jgi:hypothetical protein